MIEIKFRFEHLGEIFDVMEIDFKNKKVLVDNCDWFNFGIGTLMQFTGLKDKNGKEIFEGDILSYGNKKDGIIIQIVWIDLSDNGFNILRQKDKNVMHDIRIYRFDEQAEVIGNIWENPELLEDKK